MRRLLAIALLLFPVAAWAQEVLPFQLPAQTVIGRPNINSGQATSIPFGQLSSGLVPFLQSNGGIRVRLNAPLTLYANFASGSDANNCTLQSAPCKTVQQAYNQLVSNYDTAGFPVTISFANNDSTCVSIGTSWTGGGAVTIQGPGGSPPAVGITCTSGPAVSVTAPLPAPLNLVGFKMSGGTYGVYLFAPGLININNLNFGAVSLSQIATLSTGGKINCAGDYTISGGALFHFQSITGGEIACNVIKITLAGTPGFSQYFAAADTFALLYVPYLQFSGSATGKRYLANLNGVVNTGTGNPTFFPGNAAGDTFSGGKYQ